MAPTCAAMYLILVKDSPGSLTTTGVLFYNATLSLPLLVAALAVSGEPRLMRTYVLYGDAGFRVRHRTRSGASPSQRVHSHSLCTLPPVRPYLRCTNNRSSKCTSKCTWLGWVAFTKYTPIGGIVGITRAQSDWKERHAALQAMLRFQCKSLLLSEANAAGTHLHGRFRMLFQLQALVTVRPCKVSLSQL